MLKNLAFIAYTAAIPIVPLWGYGHYRKAGNEIKKIICAALFGLQVLLSIGYILTYFGMA